jgi:hypothetical protein
MLSGRCDEAWAALAVRKYKHAISGYHGTARFGIAQTVLIRLKYCFILIR